MMLLIWELSKDGSVCLCIYESSFRQLVFSCLSISSLPAFLHIHTLSIWCCNHGNAPGPRRVKSVQPVSVSRAPLSSLVPSHTSCCIRLRCCWVFVFSKRCVSSFSLLSILTAMSLSSVWLCVVRLGFICWWVWIYNDQNHLRLRTSWLLIIQNSCCDPAISSKKAVAVIFMCLYFVVSSFG